MPKVIGVMSGSSCDGADVWVADSDHCHISTFSKLIDYPKTLQKQLLAAAQQEVSVGKMFALEHQYTNFLARELQPLVAAYPDIEAVGVHGPTIFHQTAGDAVASKQLLQAERLCELLQIPVVSDFRSRDLTAGGQGAPLAPLYHQARFAKTGEKIAVINLGGIANVSIMDSQGGVIGYDIGPGNALLDTVTQKHFMMPYDRDGKLAAAGVIDELALAQMRKDPFFHKKGPKSIHRDYFNFTWLQGMPSVSDPRNLLRTLCELTIELIEQHVAGTNQVLVVGGGANNQFIIESLKARCAQEVYIPNDNDFIEAQLVAWLTVKRISDQKLDYTQITGANRSLLYGEIFQPC